MDVAADYLFSPSLLPALFPSGQQWLTSELHTVACNFPNPLPPPVCLSLAGKFACHSKHTLSCCLFCTIPAFCPIFLLPRGISQRRQGSASLPQPLRQGARWQELSLVAQRSRMCSSLTHCSLALLSPRGGLKSKLFTKRCLQIALKCHVSFWDSQKSTWKVQVPSPSSGEADRRRTFHLQRWPHLHYCYIFLIFFSSFQDFCWFRHGLITLLISTLLKIWRLSGAAPSSSK